MRQELEFFSKKEEKIVVEKGIAFTVIWTHIRKVIRDPRPQSWGWIPNRHTPYSPIVWWDAMIMPGKQLLRFCLWVSFQHEYSHPLLTIWAILEARGTYFPAEQEMTAWGPLAVSRVTALRHHGSSSTIRRRKPLPLCQVLHFQPCGGLWSNVSQPYSSASSHLIPLKSMGVFVLL